MRLFPIIIMVTLCVASVAGAGIVDLGVIGDYTWSRGMGVNNSSQVSGESSGTINPYDWAAFSYLSGVKTALPSVVTGTATRTEGSEGINDSGDIVGHSGFNQGRIQATLWRNSGGGYVGTNLGALGGDIDGNFKSAALGISASGNIIGGWSLTVATTSGTNYPVIWEWDSMGSSWAITELFSGGSAGQVNAIAGSDRVAGNSQGDAAVWNRNGGDWDRTILTNPYPGGAGKGSRGNAMNASGTVVVGQGLRGDLRQRPAKWKLSGGVWTASQLGIPAGMINGVAYGISDNSYFTVGASWYTNPASGAEPPNNGTALQMATIWLGDSLVGINLNNYLTPGSGWNLLSAYGVNDTGWITGIGIYDGQTHGFLMGPVPEPSSLCTLMMGAAACGLGLLRRRR